MKKLFKRILPLSYFTYNKLKSLNLTAGVGFYFKLLIVSGDAGRFLEQQRAIYYRQWEFLLKVK
jgi:hypothetical protein